MRNRIRYFLKLRRQSDGVKMICVLALAGLVSLISTLYHAWEILCYINTPVEYVLTGDGIVSKECVDGLLQSGDVAGVSRQMEVPVIIMYQGAAAALNCTMLSQEYMEEMFDAELSAGTKRIYMNGTAFSGLLQSLSEKNDHIEGMLSGSMEDQPQQDSGIEFPVRYSMEDMEEASADRDGGAGASPKYKSAKLMVVMGDGQEEESSAYISDTGSRLLKEAYSLRVQFKKRDLDGLHVSNLRKLGYMIENEDELIKEEYEVKIKLLHIRYGLILCVVCSVAVFTPAGSLPDKNIPDN